MKTTLLRGTLFSSVLLFSSFLACERNHRQQGGEVTYGSLGTSAEEEAEQIELAKNGPSVSSTPGHAHLDAISPTLIEIIDGAAVYAKSCAACHQAHGNGIPAVFPPLNKSPYVTSDDTERLASIVLYGLAGPIKVLGQDYSSAMAGLGAQYSNEELAAAVSYVRSSWENDAAEVNAEVFAKMREKWGSRGPFAIDELGREE